MVNFKGLTAKAKQLAQRNPDKVDKVLDQAGRFVDKRTGRKYERHVGTVQQKARQFLGGGHAPGGPTTSGPAPGGPTSGEHRDGQPGGPAATDRPGDVPGHEGQGPGHRL
ncbi:antitoxin [Kocuria arenosa]|uniref:antitoxin n=1 Tax=Kocuria arenosa TaxID=3071446 RepID=UPI0034D7B27A